MRSLNKIIFVNSAATQYAEISLDGNVHLIGTQGVGKSTLLRAILFFYNADKTKLGIPREKKNFDQYYFPYQNSYIIYQVKREDITYCVVAFRSQGRVAFRFFDAAYDKRYFINEMGMAYPTAEQTASFAGEAYYTRIVNNYEEYRNILYGNNAGLATEFRKYALLQSKQYQNIPRTIQNVFLNSNLDAAFIKETIIKSLSEEEIKIDLSTYAHNHLRNFETELNDIRIWSQKNKAGKILVREQGEAVATTTRAYVLALEEKKSYSRQLGWFLQFTKEELPRVEEQLDKAIATRAKVLDKLSGLRDKFNNRKIDLNSTIQSVSSRLKELKEKKETYLAQDIEAVLSRASKKSAWEGSKELLEEERRLLTLKFQDIQERYKAQLRLLENESEKLNNHLAGVVLELKEDFFDKKQELEARFEKLQDEINLQHRELLEQAQNELSHKEKRLQELAIKKASLEHQQYLKHKREELGIEEQNLQKQLQKWQVEVEEAERESRYIKGQWEIAQTKTENDFQNIFKELARSRSELEKERELLARKLANTKGSFYEWLNSNYPGWESSIGKVVDQDSILFSKNLEPSLIQGAGYLYGVQLDLSALDGQVKTLEDYQMEEQNLAKAIAGIASREQEKAEELEKAKQLLKKKHRTKINDLKDQINTANYQLQQYAPKLTQTQNELHDLNKKADALKAKALSELVEQLDKQLIEIGEAKEQLEKLRARLKRNLAAKKKELKDLIGGEESKLKKQQGVLENQKTQQQDQIAQRKEGILGQQRSELKSQGADTGRISTLDQKLEEIGTELTFIASNQELVFSYHKDRRELFEREPEFKNRRSLLRKQLQGEEAAFESEHKALNLDLDGRTHRVKELEDKRNLSLLDLEKFEGFKSWQWFGELEKELEGFTSQDKTTQRGSYLIDQIQTQHYRGQEKLGELKAAVNQFTGNFGEYNIFKFPTRFSSTAEYLEFAQDLREFLQEDKILEYESRVNERFAHIVRQVGKETGELQSKEGEIHQVIQKINSDFRSRNFVGAIKSMELRTIGSSNKIMQILLEIKNFNDQNGMLLGETNLFSSEQDQHGQNARAVGLLKQLLTQINLSKTDELKLADSFGLEFRIVENDNDSQWVEKLSNVGSEGTDVLVKAMINILLLNVFKDSASKKFKDFKLHCMMDEIGRLHPNNVKGILKFANDRNILLINGSPTSHNATEYRYTYILSKNAKNFTTAKRLIQKVPSAKTLD